MSTAQIVQTVVSSALACVFVHTPVRLVMLDTGLYH